MNKFVTVAMLLTVSFIASAQERIDRPTVQFNSESYYLAGYEVGFSSNSQIETYFPKDSDDETWSKALSREHLLDVTNLQHAVAGLASSYEDYQLPFQRVKSDDPNNVIIKATYYSPVHPLVIDKKIAIFKKDPQTGKVIIYTYTDRSFNDPEKFNFKELQKNKQDLLIDDKYVEMMKNLILQ